MNIVNELYYNGIQCISKVKTGQKYLIYLSDGSSMFMNELKKVDIVCTICKRRFYRCMLSKHIYKLYICHLCSVSGERNGFFGKHHTKKSKKLIGGAVRDYSGKNNPMYGKSVYDGWILKFGKEIADKKFEEMKIKDRNSNLGEKNAFFGKTHTKKTKKILLLKYKEYCQSLSEEDRRAISKKQSDSHIRFKTENPEYYSSIKAAGGYKSHISQMNNKKPNKIESKILKYLKTKKIKARFSIILGKYQYDVGVKKLRLLLEVDGDYWHGNPLLYNETGDFGKRKLNIIQKNKMIRDKEKTQFAISHGFHLLRIWETDINSGKFKQQIDEVINEIQIGSDKNN